MQKDQQQQQLPKAEIERYVGLCIAHLQDHASHYLSLIHSKHVEGVLWAVFRIGERPLPVDGSLQGVELAKASFLALSSMASSKADVLLRMQRECDQHRQFVCWFTLDDGFGNVLASKVLMVDAGSGNSNGVGEGNNAHGPAHHRASHDELSSVSATMSSGAADRVNGGARGVGIPERRDTTPSTHGKGDGAMNASIPHLNGGGRSNSPKSIRELLAAVARQSSSSTTNQQQQRQQTQHQQQAQQHHSAGGNVGPLPDPRMLERASPPQPALQPQQKGDALDETASMSMLMRMVMQVADSVASMGAAMDQVSARCGAIEQEFTGIKARIREIEIPMFGSDYEFTGGANAEGRKAAQGTKSPPTSSSSPARHAQPGAGTKTGARSLLSASDMLMQMTELSLRVGEAENRVRVLENYRESTEKTRLLLHDQIEGLRARMTEFARQQAHHLPAASAAPRGALPDTSDASEYPWRRQQQLQQQRQEPSSSTPTQPSRGDSSTGFSGSNALLPASVKTMDAPFSGYAPPISLRSTSSPPRVWQQAMTGSTPSPSRDDGSSVASTGQHRPGGLTDMIRSLEVKLGGIRSGAR